MRVLIYNILVISMIFFYLNLAFLALIYEYIYINEDFLFLISFIIFFYNVVKIVSASLYSELAIRRGLLNDLNKFYLNLRKQTLLLNLFTFRFFLEEDMESNIFSIFNSLTSMLQLLLSADTVSKNSYDLTTYNFITVSEVNNVLTETYSLEQFS